MSRAKLTQAEVRAMHDAAKRISIARDALMALYVYGIVLEVSYRGLVERWVKFARGEGVAFDKLKRDPRDEFARVGGFHGARDRTDRVTFLNADRKPQGNGEVNSHYCVVLPGKGRRGRR